jgi:hypothetical protein
LRTIRSESFDVLISVALIKYGLHLQLSTTAHKS